MECIAIGTIHTPFKQKAGMPIQPVGAQGVEGRIEIHDEFRDGLKDLDGFSHIILLYHLHKSEGYKLRVVPFLDSVERGLFATRAPRRPNSIGLSVVKLNRIESGILYIENVDMLDGTPLLDIKPYVPEFDCDTEVRIGWVEKSRRKARTIKSDQRFEDIEKS